MVPLGSSVHDKIHKPGRHQGCRAPVEFAAQHKAPLRRKRNKVSANISAFKTVMLLEITDAADAPLPVL
jgi:hypothetical protein